MPMARVLPETIDTMLLHIPEGHQLRGRLEAIRSSSAYAPPEAQSHWWGQTSIILKSVLPAPTEDWHYLVLAEFSQIPIGDLKSRWNEIRNEHPES